MERFCRLSDKFCISCGTVTIDPDKDELSVLLIRWRRTGEFFLPKGRKNIGETLQEAAERETYEETGIRVKIVPMSFITLATQSYQASSGGGGGGGGENPNLHTEPVAVTGREVNGILKIIYWFVARADSTMLPETNTQQAEEDFESQWVPINDVSAILSWQDDRNVVQGAMRAYRFSQLITGAT